MCPLQESADEASGLLAEPVLGTDAHGHDVALPVYDEAGRGRRGAVEGPNFLVLIEKRRESEPDPLHVGVNQLLPLAKVHSKDDKAPLLVFLVEPLDGRKLLPTIWSPGRPEGKEYHLAPVVR